MHFIAGMLCMALICALGIPTLAAMNKVDWKNVETGGIRIVVDGQELHPTDGNGKPVSPVIYDGTTYLPVRAVASALGKAVSWDGPTWTVYLGNMQGKLEYPTVMLKDMTSIEFQPITTTYLTDNYGNRYNSAIYNYSTYSDSRTYFRYLLNMKYSRFKGTLYIPEGVTGDGSVQLTIEADGRVLYTSPDMSKTSTPVPIDVNVTGYNDIEIYFSAGTYRNIMLCLADAGFYQ